MRTCAVASCSNNVPALRRWRQQHCAEHNALKGSDECSRREPFHLMSFPSAAEEPALRELWIKQINRKVWGSKYKRWEPNAYSRVCSIHFEPGATIPTLALGYIPKPLKARPDPKKRKSVADLRPKKRQKENVPQAPSPRTPQASSVPPTGQAQHPAMDLPSSPDISLSTPPLDVGQSVAEHSYASKSACVEACSCDGCAHKDTLIKALKDQVTAFQDELEATQEKLSAVSKTQRHNLWTKFVNTDKAVKRNTGVPSKATLEQLFTMLEAKARRMRYWQGQKRIVSTKAPHRFGTPRKPGPKRKLPLKAEMVMALMRLRQGLSSEFLASLFGISAGTCSSTITTWIKFLAEQLKNLIQWPDVVATRQLIPKSLAGKYPRLRCTIDCTEVYIERSRNLQVQALTYSNYKKDNTVKFLVCIAPNGAISFVSEAWGGRASDRTITLESKVLDRLDVGDVVLADRGFTIASDLLQRGCHLEVPPPASGLGQMTRTAVKITKKVANARIHVERVINRLKWFRILKNVLPLSMVPLIDDIVTVCAAICNLHPPLVT
ncbi:hypothetical protein BaRGS_00032381 [Batillaria attramentaria]|uniref:THAP-type domain-containing protein n=1 Tax=Batillaria attramentaria TaxID=370345 RepID=A0ABD0JNL2_9CAEN